MNRILIVEDSPTQARLLQLILEEAGLAVEVVPDGREALTRVAEHPPDLILLDLELPGLHGFEVCRRIKSEPRTRLIPVVILTGKGGAAARLQAWELGADDFLTKPSEEVEILARCRSLLRLKGVLDELDSAQAVVFALARAVEAKSPYTHGHSERVATYALALAGRLGLDTGEIEVLRRGALLHDIGKISVPDAVLNKAGPLTPGEHELIKSHPLQGAHIVEPLRSVRDTLPLVRWHHERLDGRGYPDGLRGEEIPLLVRVLSVADVYDAVASARPYRPALPPARCLEVLRDCARGRGLDHELVECFCAAPPLSSLEMPGSGSGWTEHAPHPEVGSVSAHHWSGGPAGRPEDRASCTTGEPGPLKTVNPKATRGRPPDTGMPWGR